MKLLKESSYDDTTWSFSNDNLEGLAEFIGNKFYKMISAKYPSMYWVDRMSGWVFVGEQWGLDPSEADLCIHPNFDITLDKLKELYSLLKSNSDYLSIDVLVEASPEYEFTSINDLTEDDIQEMIEYCNEPGSGADSACPFIAIRYKLIEDPFFFV